ncbi:MAG: hypothetical protein MUP82_10630 [Candidatus Marinimicrobia bacterium]|nr:hypothetical protein [Candidatus Neomarinimicrobiota bacterium]
MDNNKLYFIPILTKAFEDPEPVEAFKLALQEIIRLGTTHEYKEGYKQFELFLGSGIGKLIKDNKGFSDFQVIVMERLMARLATDNFTGPSDVKETILKMIKANPKLNQKYNKFVTELPKIELETPILEIGLYRTENLVESQGYPKEMEKRYFKNIKPGQYILKLSNGRVIWEGNIAAQDVIWKKAFPDRDYAMAAETVKQPTEPTRSLKILNGQIKLTFEAGLETGKIRLELSEDQT